MSFEEALANFAHALEQEFGVRDGIAELSLTHELFDRVMYALYEKNKYGIRFSAISDAKVLGIPLRAKERA